MTEPPRSSRTSWLLRSLIFLVLGAIIAGLAVNMRTLRQLEGFEGQIEELDEDVDRLRWANRRRGRTNRIDLNVGTIQFLERGYSVHLEQVSYTQDGLNLSGYLGNPTNMTLTNVTLNFSAGKDGTFEEFREAVTLIDQLRVGTSVSAQSRPIAVLSPGTRATFEVTVPGVTQDDVQ